MAYSGEQIEKGAIRIHITQVEKKVNKKEHKRKMRRQAKNVEAENPQYNRYSRWVV